MAITTKYAVYFDQALPVIPQVGGSKIGPLSTICNCFEGNDPNDPTQGVVLVDLSGPGGIGINRGFGMNTLKNSTILPHTLICLQMDDSLTAAPGTGKTPIEDAIECLKAWGGRELSSADALILATHLFPASSYTDPMTEVTYNVSAPKLVDGILKRDIVAA